MANILNLDPELLKKSVKGVEVGESDFARRAAEEVELQQKQWLQDINEARGGGRPSGRDSEKMGYAGPFAFIYEKITETELEREGSFNEDEKKILYGVISVFFKFYKNSVIDQKLEKHWKKAWEPSFDWTAGVTKYATAFFYSLRAHVVGDLDRAIAQILAVGVQKGLFKDGDIDSSVKDLFVNRFAGAFQIAEDKYRNEVYAMTEGIVKPTWIPFAGEYIKKHKEHKATEFVVSWRTDAWGRGRQLYSLFRDGDLFSKRDTESDKLKQWKPTHEEALNKSAEQIDSLLDLL